MAKDDPAIIQFELELTNDSLSRLQSGLRQVQKNTAYLESNLKLAKERFMALKEAPVVLLSEFSKVQKDYKDAKTGCNIIRDQLVDLELEIKKQKKIKDLLEKALHKAQRFVSSRNPNRPETTAIILEFPHANSRRDPSQD